MHSSRVIAALSCLCLLGCDVLSGDCIDLGRFAIAFTLRDTMTNEEVTAGALATLQGHGFADTLSVPPGQSRYSIGPEREGVMLLVIQVPGYQQWTRTFTIGRSGPCDNLNTLTLDVRLQRSPGS